MFLYQADDFFVVFHQALQRVVRAADIVGSDVEEDFARADAVDHFFHVREHVVCGKAAHAPVVDDSVRAVRQHQFMDGKLFHQ